MRDGRDLWFAPTKAFSLGRRCHAFWRDGCGTLPLSGQSGNSYLVPSTPVTADAVPPSVSRRGLWCAPPARRKASPGGESGATSVATDEVEAKNYRHKSVQRCYLRPHPVRLWPDHLPLQGKAFLRPISPLRRFFTAQVSNRLLLLTAPSYEEAKRLCFPYCFSTSALGFTYTVR